MHSHTFFSSQVPFSENVKRRPGSHKAGLLPAGQLLLRQETTDCYQAALIIENSVGSCTYSQRFTRCLLSISGGTDTGEKNRPAF